MPVRRGRVALSGFVKGVNFSADPTMLQPDEVADAADVDFGLRGDVRLRKGYTKWSTSDPAGMNVGRALFFYKNATDSFLILVDDDDEVWYLNIGSSTTFSSAGFHVADSYVDSVVVNNTFYITSRGNDGGHTANFWRVAKFDGTTWSRVADTTLDGSGNEFAYASHLLLAHERVFAANVVFASAKPSRIAWSDAGAPETWQATSWIDVAPDDGTEIRGIFLFGERIVIFKDRSIHVLVGRDENSFALYPVTSSSGLSSRRAVVQLEERLYWVDPFQGIMSFDGADVRLISHPIRAWWDDNYKFANALEDFAYTDGERVFFCVSDASSDGYPNRTLVFDPRAESWTLYRFGVHHAVRSINDNQLYAIRPSNQTSKMGVFRLFDGYTDNGLAINGFFKTGWFPLSDSLHTKKRITHLDVILEAQSSDANETVNVEVYKDYRNYVDAQYFLSNYSTTLENLQHHEGSQMGNDPYGRVFAFRVSPPDTGSRFNGLEIRYSERQSNRSGVSV